MKITLEVINELKEKAIIKDYAIGGAIAALRWVEPFFTEDLDIFVILERETDERGLIFLTPIYQYLKDRGYVWEKHWIIIEGVPVDIFPADPLEKEAVEEAIEIEFEGIKTKVMTPEYLIALFLRTGRQKDKRKIEMLLEQKIDIVKLNNILSKYNLKDRFLEFKRSYGK